MKKLRYLFLLLLFTGCGGSDLGGNSATFDFDRVTGNFITTTVEVERKFLYVLNRGDNTLSAFLIEEEEEGGHDHSHAHRQILAQHDDHDDHHDHDHEDHEDHEEHEEPLALTELDGSPYPLGATPAVDMIVDEEGRYLVILEQSGNLKSYAIDGLTGLVVLIDEETTQVQNPRRLNRSHHGRDIAVLGDSASLHEVDSDGNLSVGAVVVGTSDWSDLKLDGSNAVASTPNGVVGFQWSPGRNINLFFSVVLPGATRGDLTYSEAGVWVVNQQHNSLSLLTQQANGEIALLDTYSLPASLTAPTLIATLFDGEELAVTDDDTFVVLHLHDDELEAEAELELDRVPVRIFDLPESEFVLLGHQSGEGSTMVHFHDEEDGLELHEEHGPGGPAAFNFGFSERVQTVEQTRNF